MTDTPTPPPPDSVFHISRTVDAPLDRVWQAYTDQDALQAWFGPQGFSMPHSRYDFRPGGEFHYCLRTPTGFEMWGKWLFVEIAAPHKLSMVVSFSDASGGLTRHPMSAAWPLKTLSTTTFGDVAGKTLVSIEWAPFESDADGIAAFRAGHTSMAQGCNGTFAQLEAYLAQTPTP